MVLMMSMKTYFLTLNTGNLDPARTKIQNPGSLLACIRPGLLRDSNKGWGFRIYQQQHC